MHRPTSPRLVVLLTVTALSAGLLAAPAAAQAATTAVPAADTGWLRLAHLSPDTAAVDVRVTALSGGSNVFELDDVPYGQVTAYTPLTDGDYTVSMVAAGAPASAAPVLSATVEVAAGTATTVAAYGRNADLKVRAFTDDLTAPVAGTARIRVIQASTRATAVNVATTTGLPIARGARTGTATAYAAIPAGAWTVRLTGSGTPTTASVDVASGSVTTLFVLDDAAGSLTLVPVLDSAASPVTPQSGVQTGGGGMAGRLPISSGAVVVGTAFEDGS